jgi:hypothetical protein
MATLQHEAVHALRELGLFSDAEWRVLTKAARVWIDKYDLRNRYPELSYDKLLEEAIAHEYENSGAWEGKSKTLLQKISQFFEALMNWARGLGLNSVDQIFHNIAFGEIAFNGSLRLSQDRELRSAERSSAEILALSKKLNTGPGFEELKQTADKYSWISKWGYTVLQLAERNQHIGWLRRHTQLVERWFNEKMKWTAMASETLREWDALGTSDGDKLADFIFEVEQMNYLTPLEKKQGTMRQPTAQELRTLAKRFKFSDENAALRQYVRIRKDFTTALDKIESVLIEDIQRIYPNPNDPIAAIRIAEITEGVQEASLASLLPARSLWRVHAGGQEQEGRGGVYGAVCFARAAESLRTGLCARSTLRRTSQFGRTSFRPARGSTPAFPQAW